VGGWIGLPVREEASTVVEQYDPVAQQAPALFGVGADHMGGRPVEILSGRTARAMFALNVHGWLAVSE
jgi:hypothetical protein